MSSRNHERDGEQQVVDPVVLTPAWSRALAVVRQSPYWQQSAAGMARRDAFIDAAAAYPTEEALPPRLRTVYRDAARALPDHTSRRHRSRRKPRGH